jgi:hypothetical protein
MKTSSLLDQKPAGATLDNREKARELLDAVLEKAEKLEASSFGNADGGNLGSRQSNVSMSNGPGPTAVEEGDNSRKTKTLRACSVSSQSIWIERDWIGLNPKQVKLLHNFFQSHPIHVC